MTLASLRRQHNPRLFLSRLNLQQILTRAFSEAPNLRKPKMVPKEQPQQGLVDMSKWRKVDSRLFGITRKMIPDSCYHVLRILRGEGFEAYLVGGCVRDLILNRVPKDFDVITTANLNEIKKRFHRSRIVGRRFPICMVNMKGCWIEVSSFETVGKNQSEKEEATDLRIPRGCDKKDFVRWKNSIVRDFTINSLFFDPLSDKIYDYVNGMADLKSLKLRSLGSAKLSFKEDCARILRGLRIVARLRLSISKETETAIHKCSSSISTLATSRIMMEMNYMLSYGSAEPSLELLRRFNLLGLLLPIHAAYLDQQSIRKFPQDSTMLMKLFSNLDKVVTVDQPSDCSLWIALLAFHMALISHPQDAFVVFAFASILYHGECRKGLMSARENALVTVDYLPEISTPSACRSEEQLEQEVSRFASLVIDSLAALTAPESLVKRMSKYTESSCSGLVFVPKRTGQSVAEIFRVMVDDIKSYNTKRQGYVIDYPILKKGFLHEISFVLGKIILETMRSGILTGDEVVQEETYRQLEQESIKKNPNKGKKRVLKPDSPEIKQESAKKHKLVEKKCSVLEEEMNIEEPEVVETSSLEEYISSVLGPVEKKDKLEADRLSKQKRHPKVEKEQQCIPPVQTAKRKIKTVKKKNEEESSNKDNIVNILEDISEKLPEDRQARDKENCKLSGMFNVDKIPKRNEAADKGEKTSQPQLSSLFK